MRIRGFALVVVPLAFLVVIAVGLSVSMTGSGTIGHLRPGWSILESCTPAMPGDSRGSVGSASFSAAATSTSRFVADNTVEMSSDGGVFRGRVSDVSLSGDEVSVSVAGPLQFLNVDKTMPPVWYTDANDFLGFTYGSGTGQVASVYGIAVDPVDGGILVSSYGTVDGVDRHKVIKYTSAGVYVTEFGSSGSGNGQFGSTAMGIAVGPDQSVWVGDAGNSRIQKFTTADGGLTYTYSTKVGSAGSGDGQFGSTSQPITVAVDGSGNVYASDRNNIRVQKFNSSATFQAKVTVSSSTPSGISPYGLTYNSTNSRLYVSVGQSLSTSEWPGTLEVYNTSLVLQSTISLSAPSGTTTGIGNIAASADGTIWAQWFGATFLVEYNSAGTELSRWQSLYPFSQDTNSNMAVASGSDGTYVLFRPGVTYSSSQNPYGSFYVTGFDFSPVLLSSAIETYMEACDSTLNGYTLDYQAATDPEVVFPGWSGNVWAKLKELFAIYGVELVRDDDTQTLIVRDQGSATATITNRTPVVTEPRNPTGGRIVDVVYQNPVAGGGTVWDAEEANELLSVEAGQTITRILYTDNHPAELAQPVPTDTLPIQPGQYYVVDSTGTAVGAAAWSAGGGSVTLRVGETPGTISATITGPASELSGFTGPYYFATGRDPEDTPALSIVGNGTFCTPTLFRRDGSQGSPFASPFMDTVDRVLSRGHYPSLSDPTVEIRFTCAVSDLPAMGQAVGAIITHEQSKYRITEVVRGDLVADVTAERFVTAADWTSTWSGEAASVYESYWSGYSAGDEQVQPLRHA